ncbi:hypothetical protein QR98_0030720 [Sarcoptes scabiei]|uniref:Uncharacterized protein n=1 Tax=Sarcoptes scabiei TaxID=52283 RepID=A0A132A121_SARSC|nr:hypothetical protein QR98_0030720 [Sarcoptes scabiei]
MSLNEEKKKKILLRRKETSKEITLLNWFKDDFKIDCSSRCIRDYDNPIQ